VKLELDHPSPALVRTSTPHQDAHTAGLADFGLGTGFLSVLRPLCWVASGTRRIRRAMLRGRRACGQTKILLITIQPYPTANRNR
jgi:hypothetical protein